MLNSSVLVLNRCFLPIHVTSVRRAFSLIYRDVARAVDEQYQTFDFEEWRRLAVCGRGDWVGTPGGAMRVPRVILLRCFDRIPRRHVRYSRINVFARDRFTCQYCGEKPHRSQLNLDHVIPRSLGGETTWRGRSGARRPGRTWSAAVSTAIVAKEGARPSRRCSGCVASPPGPAGLR
jgi:hypothetical protein